MTVPTFDREKEAIMKDVREMIHRNRDNGFILEELQNKSHDSNFNFVTIKHKNIAINIIIKDAEKYEYIWKLFFLSQ